LPVRKFASWLRFAGKISAIIFWCAALQSCGGGPPLAHLVSITIATTTPSITVGQVANFTVTAQDQRGNPISMGYAFTSSMPAVASVNPLDGNDEGAVTGLAFGTTQVTAMATGITSNAITITVTPGFLPSGSLDSARGNASATLLNNGKVLIAGGLANNAALSSAELYDPAARTFAATGSLNVARELHGAVLLNDGKVLIAGGFDGANYLSSAEIYDPASGQFTLTNSLVTARRFPAIAVLPNGSVLIAGGAGASGVLASAEIYDPVTSTFMPTGSLNTPRRLTTATALDDGTVLIAGGYSGAATLDTAEIYNSETGAFVQLANKMTAARNYHTATLLDEGRVLLAGGEAPDDSDTATALASAEIYDPVAQTFSATASMNTPRLGAAATLMPNATVVVTGGDTTTGGMRVPLNSVEIYDSAGPGFTYTGSMESARAGQTSTLLNDGTCFVAGGFNASGAVATSETYTPVPSTTPIFFGIKPTPGLIEDAPTASPGTYKRYGASTLTQGTPPAPLHAVIMSSSDTATVEVSNDVTNPGRSVVVGSPATATAVTITGTLGTNQATATLQVRTTGFITTGSMAAEREFFTSTLLPNGDVLVVDGNNNPPGVAAAEIYIPGPGEFFPTNGAPSTARFNHTATLLQNGKVLIVGGTNGPATPLASAEIFDPASETFSPTGSLNTARYDHTATLLNNGMVLVAGGMTSSTNHLSSAELYDPATGQFTVTNSLNIARGQHTATRLADGRVLMAGGQGMNGAFPAAAEIFNPTTLAFTTVGNLITPRTAHTATLLPSGKVLIAAGDALMGGSITSAELFDPASGTFTATGSLTTGRSLHTATLLANGLVLMTGGFTTTAITASAEVYNPATGSFTATQPMTTPRALHSAVLLQNGTVLITGGANGQSDLVSAELY
jgi:large repetitive protein